MKKIQSNKEKKDGLKLSKYLDFTVPKYFPNRGNLIDLIETIAEATIPIRGLLERGITSEEIHNRMNITEEDEIAQNIYKETQIHEDILTHSIILKAIQEEELNYSFIASEEAEPVLNNGQLGITIDPVDGSSNVSVNRTVGTIVGIYDSEGIICSFYVLYGIFTNLVISINGKVAEFILDKTSYSMTFYHFIFLEELNMPDPDSKGIRCLGGDSNNWPERCKKYEQFLIQREFKDRYSGSFVGDFHAILKYGGVYTYFPSPKPKLRLYYEWLPLAFIAKSLGGDFILYNDDGTLGRIEDVIPLNKENINKIHSTVIGGILGSKQSVNLFLET
ncbi:MAG: hypothetical protein GF317_15535 [Candidatus Lokiarchaeota archaeon]|nr:hypothetical protein [Candidatus Lokiarchaeota archaeon]MBD3200975.1 hypothetical protein [Candidatus Lokiarchaeota archaeon]